MKRLAAACSAAIAMLVAGGATGQTSPSRASTLLIPRAAEGMLEFIDPGSGLRLAAVRLDTGPRQVTVSPDGTLAAVLGCDTRPAHGTLIATLSIVELEQPRELRRIELGLDSCPRSLTWFAPDRIAVDAVAPASGLAFDASTGRTLGTPSAADRIAIERAAGTAPAPSPSTVAVQQFIAAGGHLQDVALTPVIPRAVCHACTPDP